MSAPAWSAASMPARIPSGVGCVSGTISAVLAGASAMGPIIANAREAGKVPDSAPPRGMPPLQARLSWRRAHFSSSLTVGTLTAGSFAAVATRFTVCSAVIMKYDGLDSKPEQRRWELYDLAADPQETQNVYDDPANAATIADLKTRLARLQTELGDTP